MFMGRRRASLLALSCWLGCSQPAAKSSDGPSFREPGTKLSEVTLSDTDRGALQALESELAPLASLSAADLLARATPRYGEPLTFDPQSAKNLDLIQASSLALEQGELQKLSQQGFLIVPRRTFPHMAYGYKTIYALDLPVYISLDAILTSVHLSYDAILKTLEQNYLTHELERLLTHARTQLASGAVQKDAAKDLDLYFSVALALLTGELVEPVAGADPEELRSTVDSATRAKGIVELELFGSIRDVDYSQLEPRGHYTDSAELKRYFRASMWLGRTDFRLIQTLPTGEQVFRRRQLEATLAMQAVVTGEARTAYDHIDQVISAFVGEHDYMQLREVDALITDLGGSDLTGKGDQELAQLIVEKGYGAQRIASQVIFKLPGEPTLPLDRSFALLGQRYVVDSHVFANVVYDRVSYLGVPSRYVPNPLDVAYAALGNGAALPLLESELETYHYAPDLARMRTLVDAHGDDYWSKNLYNLWLSSLRAVSAPTPDALVTSDLPSVAQSEAWQRRMLNTQLASWAELRHDTILYAKQSYTTGNACEFPDGYVDPYPEAFERLRLFALKGREIAALLPSDDSHSYASSIANYYDSLAEVAGTLRDMAEHERTGVPFDAAQMAFLNDAVKSAAQGCGGPQTYQGWYSRLLFDKSDEDMDPTIADVHTDPGGTRPAKVLHVATGLPRLMVVTVDGCEGPRAYAGVASAYHELITGLERLTDEEWAPKARDAEDVPWLKPILAE